jgi:hypothetical protein
MLHFFNMPDRPVQQLCSATPNGKQWARAQRSAVTMVIDPNVASLQKEDDQVQQQGPVHPREDCCWNAEVHPLGLMQAPFGRKGGRHDHAEPCERLVRFGPRPNEGEADVRHRHQGDA